MIDANFAETILENFTGQFISAFSEMQAKGKQRVVKYSPVIFKKWYYSSLLKGTTVSTSFVYTSSKNSDRISDGSSVFVPVIYPLTSGSYFKGFNMAETKYSLRDHPIVRDLNTLLEFSAIDLPLDKCGNLPDEDAQKLIKFMTLREPFYLDYILKLSYSLQFLKIAERGGKKVATVSKNYMSYFELNQEDSLKKLLNAAVKLSAAELGKQLPGCSGFFTPQVILSLIKKPMSFEKLCDTLCPLLAEDGDKEALCKKIAVAFDKWFLTPFGYFFKVIEPLYTFDFSFADELRSIYCAIVAEEDINDVLYTKYEHYSFTNFGRRIFSTSLGPPKNHVQDDTPESQLLSLIINSNPDDEMFASHSNSIVSKFIFTLKVKLAENKSYWKKIEVAEYNTLHDLCVEISIAFDFDLNDYKLSFDKDMSAQNLYIPPTKKGKGSKADKITFAQTDLLKGQSIYYTSYTGKVMEIEVVSIIEESSKAHYPKTTEISKKMKELYGII